jgi:hypothetical protein
MSTIVSSMLRSARRHSKEMEQEREDFVHTIYMTGNDVDLNKKILKLYKEAVEKDDSRDYQEYLKKLSLLDSHKVVTALKILLGLNTQAVPEIFERMNLLDNIGAIHVLNKYHIDSRKITKDVEMDLDQLIQLTIDVMITSNPFMGKNLTRLIDDLKEAVRVGVSSVVESKLSEAGTFKVIHEINGQITMFLFQIKSVEQQEKSKYKFLVKFFKGKTVSTMSLLSACFTVALSDLSDDNVDFLMDVIQDRAVRGDEMELFKLMRKFRNLRIERKE